MGNLSGEPREQNRKDKVTRFRSVTYARQLALLVNTLGSHLKGGFYLDYSLLSYFEKNKQLICQWCQHMSVCGFVALSVRMCVAGANKVRY